MDKRVIDEVRPNPWITLGGLVVGVCLTACSATPPRQLSKVPPAYAMLPNGRDPINPEQPSPLYAAATHGAKENFVRSLERIKGRPLNLLSLSGGGQNGAFGAGFLIGWRESGRRPVFDAVGGVSTGALLATGALLGTPEDDAELEEMYTQITKANIFVERSIFSLLSSDSLMDTKPLRELIAKYITAEKLKRVAAALEEHRYLFVGTTNVDYDQTWVWNMSLIAKDGNLDLYRKVLLASASISTARSCSPRPRSLSSFLRWRLTVICSWTVRPARTWSSPGWRENSVPRHRCTDRAISI